MDITLEADGTVLRSSLDVRYHHEQRFNNINVLI